MEPEDKLPVLDGAKDETLSIAIDQTEKSPRLSTPIEKNERNPRTSTKNSGQPDDVDVQSMTTEGRESSGEGEDADDEDEDVQNFPTSPRSSDRKSNASEKAGVVDSAGHVHFKAGDNRMQTQGLGTTSPEINTVNDKLTRSHSEHNMSVDSHHHHHHHHHHQHLHDADTAAATEQRTDEQPGRTSTLMKKVWKPPTLDEETQAGISSWDWLSRLEQLLIHFFLTIFETKNDDSKLIMELMPAEAGVQVEEIFQLLLKAEPEMYKDLGNLIHLAENWLIYWKGESEQREKAMNFVRVYLKKVKSKNYYKLPIQVRLHKLGAFIAGLKDFGKEGDQEIIKYPVYKPVAAINKNLQLISPRVKPATHFSRVVANILCGRPCTHPLPFSGVYADKLGVSSFKNTLHGDKEFKAYTDLKYGDLFRKRDIFLKAEYSSDIHLTELDAGGDASHSCIKNTNCWLPIYDKLYLDGLKKNPGQCTLVAKMELQEKSVRGSINQKQDSKLYEWVMGPDKKVHQKLVGTYTEVGATSSVDSMTRKQAGKNRSRSPKTHASVHRLNKKLGAQPVKGGRGQGGDAVRPKSGQTKGQLGHGQSNRAGHKGDKGKERGPSRTKSKKAGASSFDGSGGSDAEDKDKSRKKVPNKKEPSNRFGKNKSNERSKDAMKKVGQQGGKLERLREDQHNYGHEGRAEAQRNYGQGGKTREDQRNYGQEGRAREHQRNYGQEGRTREDQRNYGQGGKTREDQRNYGQGARNREDQRNYAQSGRAREEDQRGYGQGRAEDHRSYGQGRAEDHRSYGQGAREDFRRSHGHAGANRNSIHTMNGKSARPSQDMPYQIHKTPYDPLNRNFKGRPHNKVQSHRSLRDAHARAALSRQKFQRTFQNEQYWDGEGLPGEDTDGEMDMQDMSFLTEEQQNMMIVNQCWEKASKVLKRPAKGLVLPPPENLMLYLEHKFPGYKWGKGEPIAVRNFPNGTVFVAQYANGGSRIFYPHGGLAVAISGPSPATSQILVVRDPSDHVFFFDKALLASLNSSGKGIIYGEDGVISAEYSTIGGFKFDNGLEKGCRWLWNQGGQRLIMKLNKFISIRMSDFDKIFLNFYGNRRGFLVNVATGMDVTVMSLDKPADPAMMELGNMIRPKSIDDQFDYLKGRFSLPATLGFVDKQKHWDHYDKDDEESGRERKCPNVYLNQRQCEFERLKRSYNDRLAENCSRSARNNCRNICNSNSQLCYTYL